MRFDDLRLAEPILRAVRAEGYTTPTPIQIKAIPPVLEGRDVLGCAQTGTGKTAAFTLPILHRLIDGGRQRPQSDRRGPRPIRVLVLAPTRELAAQIGECTAAYARYTQIRHGVIFGGVGQAPQVRALRDGIDILVATPGRLLDLMEQGFVDLSRVEVLVLDEADRMLDMGFIHDIRKVVAKVPRERQTLLFSATVPDDIRQLAASLLRKPVGVQVAAVSAAADTVEQSVYFVEKRSKPALLEHFLNNNAVGRALVFTRTKHGADKVARHLSRAGIRAEAIHGNKSQNARVRAMQSFKSGAPPVLVATDIAARGLDIDEISHVINFDVPNVPETYVHRIGRTGRAGASGLAVSFCDESEVPFLRDIERLIRRSIPATGTLPDLPAPQERSGRETRAARPRRQEHGRHAAERQRPKREEGTQQRSAPRETIAAPVLPVESAPTGVGHRSRGRSRTRRGLARRR